MASGKENRAAPGLFPNLDSSEEVSETRESEKLTNEGSSLDPKLFRAVISDLPRNYATAMKTDTFYITRQYNMKAGSAGGANDICFSSFREYDSMLRTEYEMRQRLEELEKALSNSGVRLQRLDSLNALYTRNLSSSAWGKRSKRWRLMSMVRKLKPMRLSSAVSDVAGTIDTDLQSHHSDSTEIIDYIKPGCGVIDNSYTPQKTHVMVQEELEPMSTTTLNTPESRHGRAPVLQVTIQRKLSVRHLQMISLGATIGVGLFFNSGKALSIAGPMGGFIGYAVGGSLILATLFSFAEMVALIPLITGISGLSSRFVNDAFGFSVGWCHWLSYAIGFASEVVASTIMLSYYKNLDKIATSKSAMAVTIATIIIGLTLINLMDVRVYGEFEFFCSTFKLMIILLLVILMIVLNAGGLQNSYIGFRYWDSQKSPIKEITYGPFRPTFDLKDRGYGAREGIPGFGGILLSCIASSLTSVFAYVGSEIGFIAAGEAKNPRKAVPSVTKRIFTRVILFYLLSIFVVGLNVYAGDPRLLRYNTSSDISAVINGQSEYQDIFNALGNTHCQGHYSMNLIPIDNPNQSPWVIAMQSFNQCTLSSFINGVFVAIAISAGSSQLYASSRTLYSMATQQKAPKIFTTCNRSGVPYMAVLFCGALGFLSLLCLNVNSSEVFFTFVSIGALGSVIMWFGMNVAYLRFYYALKRRPDIISRDDKAYPYKSPFQPYFSIYGLLLALLLILFNGFQNFFRWNTKNFITSYLTLILFLILYVAFGWTGGYSFNKLDQMDLDSGRREMDRVIWKEDSEYSLKPKEVLNKLLSHI
ncbi:LAME_0H08548g1_1 [Lachancea meyersii CBS 8951]|uniref:LAME_0H08548g1_1 n=1 Tax=Lachancea meyersii CBS 8951 TaxID=1266667 RepID=A0A1G4KFC7_9SACH|nr:LAME_0H08548g1_1 [Lachancea meyersii CBS 8951]